MRIWISVVITFALLQQSTDAQIATGGSFTLEQSVIASGGDTSTEASGRFVLTGAIGQSITETSTTPPFKINSGFFTAPSLAPTAAMVGVSGQVVRADGNGISKALVTLTDVTGAIRTVLTNPFGKFRFDDVEVGRTYILSVESKRYRFINNTQVFMVVDEIDGIVFTAEPEASKF